jgi:ribosomal protein S18 acetylase RimI-like enzyme
VGVVTVRPAEPAEVPAIRAVAERAWRAAHEPVVGAAAVDAFLAEFYDADSFRERVAREDRHLRVAVGPTDTDERAGDPDGQTDGTEPDDADGVLGYTLSLPDDDDPGLFHLAHVYVDPDRWGEGVGRRLLGDVESLARERGADRLRLGVLAGNDRAVSFYERAGFERVRDGHDDRLDAATHTYERRLDDG